MFSTFRQLVRELSALRSTIDEGTTALEAALRTRAGDDELRERLDYLEGQLSVRLAEAEAIEIKADGRFKAARAAEERARAYAEKAEKAIAAQGDEDELGEVPEWYLEQLRGGDGGGGETNGVQPVPSRMETRAETVARLRAVKLNGGI